MNHRIKQEKEILNLSTRRQIISEINGPENLRRKHEAFKAYEVFKDRTSTWVIKELLKMFDASTVQAMSYAISNVSILRKVVNKLARVYNHGVERGIENDEDNTLKLQKLEKKLDFNTHMKTINAFLKFQKNTACYIKPCPVFDDDGEESKRINLMPLSPYFYDVVENYYDRTRPMVYILSNYSNEQEGDKWSIEPATEGRSYNTPQPPQKGDNKDQKIADTPQDEGEGEGPDPAKDERYIWWSDRFHFTTNGLGEIIDENGNDLFVNAVLDPNDAAVLDKIGNPIEEMPIVNFAIDQDNSFWAQGGGDLIHGSILINSLISNLNHIGTLQGYGQFVMKGKNLPNNVMVGPDKAIKLEYEDGEPEPSAQFVSASPNMGDLRQNIEMYVALLLTTNNLSTTGVSTTLQNNASFASGIALMIDKSESQEDVKDQQQIFLDKEPEVWRKVSKFLQHYQEENMLVEEQQDLALPEQFENMLTINFKEPDVPISESERLENLKKRKELGLNTMVELIKMDQPGLTDEQAKEKLQAVLEESIKKQMSAMNGGRNGSEGEEDEGDEPFNNGGD